MGLVFGTPDRTSLTPDARSADAWFVAGIRIDAGAPGLSADELVEFGQRPQICLVVHHVTRNPDGSVEVHDYAADLIYDFVLPRAAPDLAAFSAMGSDTAVPQPVG